MNSPFYISVVVHPDKTADKHVEVVYSGEDYSAADAQAKRVWAEAQAAWNESPNKVEPPLHDVYVCVRRLANMTDKQQADITKQGHVKIA